jgi:AraC family transcriptional regulator of arabinose operon
MDQRIQIVSSRIESDVRGGLKIEELAHCVNLSVSRLRHLFKDQTGKTPGQFLRLLKMQEATVLLQTAFLSVKEIMNRVGISNDSHFVHDFRKLYGLAPSSYRRGARVSLQLDPYLIKPSANSDKE